MSVDSETIRTYDASAEQLDSHFNRYTDRGARAEIDQAFAAADRPAPRVVEIGCGAGKDAAAILEQAAWYEGFDPSAGLLAIAKTRVPAGSFVQADALSYDYPSGTDIVFAFASLLHLNKEDFAAACRKISVSLTLGGILCMTLKEADTYTELVQEDAFGRRRFYLYSAAEVRQLAGPEFALIHESHTTAGPEAKKWMSLTFRLRDGILRK